MQNNQFKNALKKGKEIQKRINSRSKSKILEIGIDNVYKKLLLNNKKRYAGLCVINSEEIFKKEETEINPVYKIEIKGMDVIRREWCELSQDIGRKLLDLILSEDDDFKEKIYQILEEVSSNLSSIETVNSIPLEKLTMHQKVNKELRLYTGNTIAFVNVARRLQEKDKLKESQLVGKVIPYVICQGTSHSSPVYERAFHPREFIESQSKEEPLRIDGEWYLQSQIAKPVMRILSNVKQISKKKLVKFWELIICLKKKILVVSKEIRLTQSIVM